MTVEIDKEELKKRLTPLQWHVTQEKGTERYVYREFNSLAMKLKIESCRSLYRSMLFLDFIRRLVVAVVKLRVKYKCTSLYRYIRVYTCKQYFTKFRTF